MLILVEMNMPTEGDGYIYIKNLSRSAVITNVKSSNKYYTASKAAGLNAVYVQTTSDSGPIHYVKDGEKTKLRFTVKQNGKSYNLSCAVTFKKALPSIYKCKDRLQKLCCSCKRPLDGNG